MSDPAQYTYPSPIADYTFAPPLPTGLAPDGKSLVNPTPTIRSPAYTNFASPITNGPRGGFDIHVYYNAYSASQLQFAQELHSRIRYEFPELRIYKLSGKPIGPHTMAMFEVNLFTPEQFGAFVSWLVVERGPLSALVHPNTGDPLRDHTQRATWLGEKVVVDTTLFWDAKKSEESEVVSPG
jgi:aromatic ring-cleaving dioxygenase